MKNNHTVFSMLLWFILYTNEARCNDYSTASPEIERIEKIKNPNEQILEYLRISLAKFLEMPPIQIGTLKVLPDGYMTAVPPEMIEDLEVRKKYERDIRENISNMKKNEEAYEIYLVINEWLFKASDIARLQIQDEHERKRLLDIIGSVEQLLNKYRGR